MPREEQQKTVVIYEKITYYSLPWAPYCIRFDLNGLSFITWFRSEEERQSWYRDFLRTQDSEAA